jgi:hypothetical protein
VADRDAGTQATLNSMTSSDYVYLGSTQKFRRFYVDVGATNGTGSRTMTVQYWNGSAWAAVASLTDGTSSSTMLDQDGEVIYTLPSTWAPTTVNGSLTLYWVRFKPSGTLDATVDIDEIILGAEDENYGYFEIETTQPEVSFGCSFLGGIVLVATSGTPAAHIDWQRFSG